MRDVVRRRAVVAIDWSNAEGLAAVAPVPARPAATAVRRFSALAAMLTVGGGLAAFASFAWHHRVDEGGRATPPFQLTASTRQAALRVATRSDRSCPAPTPLVMMYVSSTCTHCKAELERWSKRVRTKSPPMSCIGIAIVAAPTPVSNTSWLPAEFSSSLLWDHDHEIARELEVRLVPLTAFVTQTGVVISKSIGEASEESISRQLVELRQVSNNLSGVHKNE